MLSDSLQIGVFFVHVFFRTFQPVDKREDHSIKVYKTRLFKECTAELNGSVIFVHGAYFLYRQFNDNICLFCKWGMLLRGYGNYGCL